MLQKCLTMAGDPIRVLLIQSWVIRGSALRDELRSAGFEPFVFRVDFEHALAAALPRGGYDVVILDTKSSGVPRAVVEALMRAHAIKAPLIELHAGRPIGMAVREAVAAIRN